MSRRDDRDRSGTRRRRDRSPSPHPRKARRRDHDDTLVSDGMDWNISSLSASSGQLHDAVSSGTYTGEDREITMPQFILPKL